jgi:hypothetical protein
MSRCPSRRTAGAARFELNLVPIFLLPSTFQVTDTAQRVAIPYPAPYPAGKGVLAVEGEASGVVISLAPDWRIEALHGMQTLDVWWETNKPC